MKKASGISVVIALFVLISIISCKKDDKVETPVAEETNCYLTKMLEEGEDAILSFNDDNKLIKVTDSYSNDWFGSFEYNSNGQMAKMCSYNNQELSDYDTIIYNADGLPIEVLSFWGIGKASYVNSYFAHLLSSADNYDLGVSKYGNENSILVLSSKIVLEYSENENITKSIYYGYSGNPVSVTTSYSTFDYDSNNNMTKKTMYQLNEDQLYHKKSEYTYTYDDKNHCLKNIGMPQLGDETFINNILSFTNVRYENDTIYYSDSGTNIYEYNDNDYPLKVTITTENYTDSRYFEYDCK